MTVLEPHRHKVMQRAVVCIGGAAEVGDPGIKYRNTQGRINKADSQARAKHPGFCVHAGSRHTGDRVVMVDHAMMGQCCGSIHKGLVSGSWRAIGIE
ncbi:hypothetical protein D3C79_841390 [compost metagenome]